MSILPITTARALTLGSLLVLGASSALAGDPVLYDARQGTELANSAASAWAPDAVLVYVENDEPLSADGRAERWGYLYYSASLDAARGYSLEEDKIVVAENLGLTFEAPPLSPGWITSARALTAAEEKVGRKLREKSPDVSLETMLLMRGAFLTGKPDMTTWLVVYAAPGAPSTFVVVDAETGDVRRTWRG